MTRSHAAGILALLIVLAGGEGCDKLFPFQLARSPAGDASFREARIGDAASREARVGDAASREARIGDGPPDASPPPLTEGGTSSPEAGCAPSCPDLGCGPASCTGCCGKNGSCEPGTSTGACGKGGIQCRDCGTGSCDTTTGACVTIGPACDPFLCLGCCDTAGICQGGASDTACGTKALPCENCASWGQVCSPGGCTSSGTHCVNCPTGCCNFGICESGNTSQFCGTKGAACKTCPAPQICVNQACQ